MITNIVRHIRGMATIAKIPRKQPLQKSQPLITCKLDKFNLSVSEAAKISPDTKFGQIPLASYGWTHYKAKNDYFTIHPIGSIEELTSNQRFDQLPIDGQLLRNITNNLSFSHMAWIQKELFSHISAMEHIVTTAETGCGKTLAYLVPIVQHLLVQKANEKNGRNMNTPLALVLTPSRELAEQIGEVAQQLCYNLNVNVKVQVGGKVKQNLANPEFEDVDLLIGSIGAMSKLVTTGIYRMTEVRHIVLDEADTLLDNSFSGKLIYFLKRFPFHNNIESDSTRTQLVLVAATMPTNREILRPIIDPSTLIDVTSPNLHRIIPHVKQTFLRMSKINRPIELLAITKRLVERKKPLIVFGNKSMTSDYISIFLNDNGIEAVNLNGDMLQKIRIGRFDSFQRGEINVLVTTDMASRGLDTTRVRHIINFDFPLYAADYIHRIGRIGRIGSHENCEVTNFVSSLREIDLVQKIEHSIRTKSVLTNVNANITDIIQRNILGQQNASEINSVLPL